MTDAQLARLTLQAARELIKSGQYSYICNALDAVGSKHPLRRRASRSLTSWIGVLLGIYMTYDSWIVGNHPNLGETRNFADQCRQGRLAWIDWMLTQDLGEVMKKY